MRPITSAHSAYLLAYVLLAMLHLASLTGCGLGAQPRREAEVSPNLPFAARPEVCEPTADLISSRWVAILNGEYWAYSRAAREIMALEERALAPLAERLDDRRHECGQPVAVAQALIGQICRELDVDRLHHILVHPAPVVRFEAVRELERRGLGRSVNALESLAHDPHPRVRQAASRARNACQHPDTGR